MNFQIRLNLNYVDFNENSFHWFDFAALEPDGYVGVRSRGETNDRYFLFQPKPTPIAKLAEYFGKFQARNLDSRKVDMGPPYAASLRYPSFTD